MKKPHVLSFTLLKGNGFFHFYTPKEKHIVRKIVRDLNRVFIPKKVNEEFD